MNDELPNEAMGTIVGIQASGIRVRLHDGREVLCRGVKQLHRTAGFLKVPIGVRVRIREPRNKTPLIVEFVKD